MPDLPPQVIGLEVLRERYAHGAERDATDVQRRVARALASAEPAEDRTRWQARFLEALQAGFIPAGRIQAAAGTSRDATLINCFVQPVGGPSPAAGRDASVEAAPDLDRAVAEALATMRLGGGVGYDLSDLPPRDAQATDAGGRAAAPGDGPLAALHRLDRACEALEATGGRRGAQMGVLRVDHPDIEAFIQAKDAGGLPHFNLSVGVTDAFMRAVVADGPFDLVHRLRPGPGPQTAVGHRPWPAPEPERSAGGWRYRRLPARDLWARVMRSAFHHGEPGVLFLDAIQRDDNLAWCETIVATNPCGEAPLPPYGSCCLGSIDLTRFVQRPFEGDARFDEAALRTVAAVAVRMLDNVLDLTRWPLPTQRVEALATRRIGLGFTGLGDALVMLGLRYDTEPARARAARIAEALRDAAYEASIELARERGAFPRFDAARYLAGTGFAARLPVRLRARIREHGIRHSHLLAIAPTGTISLAFADNVSPGVEPPFGWTCLRWRRSPGGGTVEHRVEDHAWRLYRHRHGPDTPLTRAFVTALEMRPIDQVTMVAAVAPFVDGAISKTVNVPASCPFDAFHDLYRLAWVLGLKGLSTYRPNSVLGEVLRPQACR